MKPIIFFSLLAYAAFQGCATYSHLFVTAEGQIIVCSATGNGIIGMATASNAERSCEENMKAAGNLEIERAGAVGITLSAEKSDSLVRIIKIMNGSPAQAAGILSDDRLVMIDSIRVSNSTDAHHLLFGVADTKVHVQVRRNGQNLDFVLTRAPYSTINKNPVVVSQTTHQGGSYLGIRVHERGRILDVDDHSPADSVGLRRGDVIVAIDDTPIPNPPNLDELNARLSGNLGTYVKIDIHRGYTEMSFMIKRAQY